MDVEVNQGWIVLMANLLVCEIMEKMSGIHLEHAPPPEEANRTMDAVLGVMDGTYPMKLQFRAEPSLFCRLARNIMGEEPQDAQEIQEYATEFFNVLCGRFISELYYATQSPVRLYPPQYKTAPHVTSLEGLGTLSTLCFLSEQGELAEFSWTNHFIEDMR